MNDAVRCFYCGGRDCQFLDTNARGYPVFHCGGCNRSFSRPIMVNIELIRCPRCGEKIPHMERGI